jgi:hypothetical protein
MTPPVVLRRRYTMRVADKYGEHGTGVEVATNDRELACQVAALVQAAYPKSVVLIDDDEQEAPIDWTDPTNELED